LSNGNKKSGYAQERDANRVKKADCLEPVQRQIGDLFVGHKNRLTAKEICEKITIEESSISVNLLEFHKRDFVILWMNRERTESGESGSTVSTEVQIYQLVEVV